jgi:hypothetical protein
VPSGTSTRVVRLVASTEEVRPVVRELHAYTYVKEPYDEVTEVLASSAPSLVRAATAQAAEHTRSVVTTLYVPVAGFAIGREVVVRLGPFVPESHLRVRLAIAWRPVRGASVFPALDGQLEVAALSLRPPLTQITLSGCYTPPLGPLGTLGDTVVGHRVAEAAAHRFVTELAERLRAELSARHTGSATMSTP